MTMLPRGGALPEAAMIVRYPSSGTAMGEPTTSWSTCHSATRMPATPAVYFAD